MERHEWQPLTVRELIEQLSQVDPDLPVACRYDGSQETGAGPVTVEEVTTWGVGRDVSMTFAVIGDRYRFDDWMRSCLQSADPEARTAEG